MATNTPIDKQYSVYDLEKTKEQVKAAIDAAYNSITGVIEWSSLSEDVQDKIVTPEILATALAEWDSEHGNGNYYGECSTTSDVADKQVNIENFPSALAAGLSVRVKFYYRNNMSSPTLQINNTSAKPILKWYSSGVSSPVSPKSWTGGQVIDFVYDGYGWVALGLMTSAGEIPGIVKLSDSVTSTSTVSDGIAATPKAVKAAYDKAVEAANGMIFVEGAFVNGTMSLAIPEISELTDKQTIRVRFTSDVIPYSTGLKLSINNGTAYSILLSNQNHITVDNYGTNVLWHSGSSIVLIYNLVNTCWMVDNSEYADRCYTSERASAVNGNAITLSGSDIKQISHNGTKRNLMATDYDISNGTIKAKFDAVDGQISAHQTRISSAEEDIMMIAATGVCTDDDDSDHDDKTIVLNNTIVTPLQNGQRLTVTFTEGLSALPGQGRVYFTVDNGTTYYEFLPNGEDHCCGYAYFEGAVFADLGVPIEVEFDENAECWKLVDSAYAYNSMQAYRVGVDFDEEKLIKMDSLIDYAKYYDGRALTPTSQGQFTWGTPSNGTVGILRYNGNATEVIVPPLYYLNGNTYRVTGLIGQPNPSDPEILYDGVFDSNGNIETVVLPNTITTIGRNAFLGCTSLESVNVPSSVTTIGESAFEGCTDLTSLIIPGSINAVDNHAFSYCSNLTVYCYQGSAVEDSAIADNIPVEHLDDVISYSSSSDDDIEITVKNGKEYRCLNDDSSTPLTTLTVNLPAMDTTGATNIKTEFDSLVTFYCGSSSFQFNGAYPSTGTTPQFIQYFGKDCDDGVFLPSEKGYVYNLAYWWNGKMYVCTVV